MGLFDFFSRAPSGEGGTLVLAEPQDLARGADFVNALAVKFSRLTLAGRPRPPAAGTDGRPAVEWPADPARAEALLRKLHPQRLVVVGAAAAHLAGVAVEAPLYWVNARGRAPARPRLTALAAPHHRADYADGSELDAPAVEARATPHPLPAPQPLPVADAPADAPRAAGVQITGDPLLNLRALPPTPLPDGLCERFREQREGGRWVAYFAATGEDEEEIAYSVFNRLMRHRMGLMVLAPFDAARYEPVYREAIKYRLQTIRHNRLSTSFVPIRTRVYYVEKTSALHALYACADFVVAGATLSPKARHAPDVLSALACAKPVIVGPACRDDPTLAAAVAAGAVLAADETDAVFEHARHLLDNPAAGREQGERGREWLAAQPGALARVLALID